MIRSHAAGFLVIALLTVTTGIGAQVVAPPAPSSPLPAPNKSQKNKAPAPKPCGLPGISAQRVQEAVDASAMLQPPLAADAMIRIATKVSSPCPTLATDWLSRAFDQADGIEPATAYKLALAGGLTDSRISYADHGYSQQMDRLSLQSRAVLGMTLLDAKVSIELFRRIPPPRPAVVGCSSAFVPDVLIYYHALGKVLPLLKARKPRNDIEMQVASDTRELRARRDSYMADRELDQLLEATNARRRARGEPERTRDEVRREFGGAAPPSAEPPTHGPDAAA